MLKAASPVIPTMLPRWTTSSHPRSGFEKERTQVKISSWLSAESCWSQQSAYLVLVPAGYWFSPGMLLEPVGNLLVFSWLGLAPAVNAPV